MSLIGYSLIISFALEDFLAQSIGYIIAFVIGVASAVLAGILIKKRERPKVIIDTAQKDDRLGFSVSVRRRMIKDARVRCNNIDCSWEDTTKIERKDLYVGDVPSLFFPFQVNVEYTTDISKYPTWATDQEQSEGGVLVTVKEITTQKIVYVEGYSIPKKVTAIFVLANYANRPLFNATVRIIGEGVEEERDYSLHVGLNNLIIPAIREGKPIMNYVQCGFMLKKKRAR